MIQRCCLFFSLVLLSTIGFSQSSFEKHGRLKISSDGRYIQYADGTPFFWLADTGWELFHRLKLEEIDRYLDNRASKGFNIIQAVALAEFDGLKKPDQYGNVPLQDLDPAKPNEAYFKFVDEVMKMAAKKNLFIAFLPTWGDKVTKMWGEGPMVFNKDNAYQYGLFLGKRYKDYKNIIWMLGGDRPPVKDSNDWRPIWRSMAAGILEGTSNQALITYHISGGPHTTSEYLHNESWLQINSMQSGHGNGHDVKVWEWIARDRALTPVKPTFDSEPNYEDHPVNPWPKWDSANGYFRDYDVRKQTYRSVFAGACGVTYGHHSVWQFWSPREEKVNHADRYWTEAIDRPGAFQVGYLRFLVESRPSLTRIPDQGIIATGQGEAGEYIAAMRDANGSYAMIYIPFGKTISVKPDFIKGNSINAWWFNPKTGKATSIGAIKKQPVLSFTTPTSGAENDWVLVMDDSSYKYGEPGKIK